MAEQKLKFKISDIANLILSLSAGGFCAKEVTDKDGNTTYYIMDYVANSSKINCTGTRFRITIFNDKIELFHFPTLRVEIPISTETEYQEILGLYLDFSQRVEDYLTRVVKDMIQVKTNHKNPWDGFEVFMEQQREAERANANRRRWQQIHFEPAEVPLPDQDQQNERPAIFGDVQGLGRN